MNHSGRARRTRKTRDSRRRTRRTGGMKRGRSPQREGRTPPPKYLGVPPAVPMGIPVKQNPQEQMPPMGIPLGRGVSRRRPLKKRRRSRKMRGGSINELKGVHIIESIILDIQSANYHRKNRNLIELSGTITTSNSTDYNVEIAHQIIKRHGDEDLFFITGKDGAKIDKNSIPDIDITVFNKITQFIKNKLAIN